MINKELSKIFSNISIYLQMKKEMVFKIRAYENASRVLDEYPEDIELIL